MRLALTQRVVTVASYGERRDALDQRWMPLAAALGVTPVIVPNGLDDVAAYLGAQGLDGAILSGGNNIDAPVEADGAPERDATERALLAYCEGRGLPVVGVCRGMQMLQRYAGGALTGVAGHAGTRHGLSWSEDAPSAGRSAEVNSYHDFGIAPDAMSPEYRVLARAPDGTVEAAAHRRLPWLGIMWHPEREPVLVPADLHLIRLCLEGKPL